MKTLIYRSPIKQALLILLVGISSVLPLSETVEYGVTET